MTPAETAAMWRAWRNKERRVQSRFAMLALVAAKCAGNKDSAIDDFMAGLAEDAE